MFIDKFTLFDNAAAHLTTGASTDYMDLGANRNIGVGENLYVIAVVTTAFTDAGSDSTMTLTLEVDDNAAFSSPTTAQTLGTFGALSAVGARLVARLQPDAINERYLRVKYTVANGDLTTGAFSVAIVHDIQAFSVYAKGYTITNP